MLETLYIIVLICNTLWFGVAFHYFSIKQVSAAKTLVPEAAWGSPLFLTIAASVRFLGGMNLAFAVLSLLMVFDVLALTSTNQKAGLLIVLAIAHGSQFSFNVPVLKGGGRQGEALWNVHQWPMSFIFSVDALLMIANAALSIAYFYRV